MLERFETPEAILRASASELQLVPGVGFRLAQAVAQSANRMEAIAEMEACRKHGIHLLTPYDEEYPSALKEIPDPPGTLYTNGDLRSSDRLAIAIVGTRHATRYGIGQARVLARGLAKAGYTIVSGLARASIRPLIRRFDAGGRTVAVLGSGLQQFYPPENVELADEIVKCGVVISEHPLQKRPEEFFLSAEESYRFWIVVGRNRH